MSTTQTTSELLSIPFRSATGKLANLGEYKGQVALVVNVASKCGLTPQYSALESLYERYRDRGFVVLGFPANEFAGQEPGTNAEIQEFCQINYGVQFPIFEKIVVKGEGQHPLYKALTEKMPKAIKKPDGKLEKSLQEHGLLNGQAHDIVWNFEKFLLNRNGDIVARFAPDLTPDDPQIIKAIEEQLG